MTAPSLESVKAIDGKILAVLKPEELIVLNFFQNRGRKFGVSVTVINEADPLELARAKSKQETDAILKSANSKIYVRIEKPNR